LAHLTSCNGGGGGNTSGGGGRGNFIGGGGGTRGGGGRHKPENSLIFRQYQEISTCHWCKHYRRYEHRSKVICIDEWLSTFFVPGPIIATHYNPTTPTRK